MPASMQSAPGLGQSPRPLSNEEQGFTAGAKSPQIKPLPPGGLQGKGAKPFANAATGGRTPFGQPK
jgi:hypothetical protein